MSTNERRPRSIVCGSISAQGTFGPLSQNWPLPTVSWVRQRLSSSVELIARWRVGWATNQYGDAKTTLSFSPTFRPACHTGRRSGLGFARHLQVHLLTVVSCSLVLAHRASPCSASRWLIVSPAIPSCFRPCMPCTASAILSGGHGRRCSTRRPTPRMIQCSRPSPPLFLFALQNSPPVLLTRSACLLFPMTQPATQGQQEPVPVLPLEPQPTFFSSMDPRPRPTRPYTANSTGSFA